MSNPIRGFLLTLGLVTVIGMTVWQLKNWGGWLQFSKTPSLQQATPSNFIDSTTSNRSQEYNDSMVGIQRSDQSVPQNWMTNLKVLEYLSHTRSDRFWDWKQPISFWGVVLDDHSNPVENATVKFTWSDMSKEGTSSAHVLTKSSGSFEIVGKVGKGLSVSVEKNGYRRCRWGVIGFEYANPTDPSYHIPDPSKPVIFRLIKRGPREPMLRRERLEFHASEDTGELDIDLVGQRQVSSQDPDIDLQVHCEHGPVSDVEGRREFDWKVTLRVPDGGIQLGSECPTEAPSDAYVPEIHVTGTSSGPKSERGVSQQWFFLRTRGGKHYGRVFLSVFPLPRRGGPPVVQIHEYVLNPSGSRNLEFYPEMDVSEKYYVPRDR